MNWSLALNARIFIFVLTSHGILGRYFSQRACFSAQQIVRLTDADVISIGEDDVALNLKEIIKTYQTGDASFQLSTAPSADGIVNRIEVEATQLETAGNWVVFALAKRRTARSTVF